MCVFINTCLLSVYCIFFVLLVCINVICIVYTMTDIFVNNLNTVKFKNALIFILMCTDVTNIL